MCIAAGVWYSRGDLHVFQELQLEGARSRAGLGTAAVTGLVAVHITQNKSLSQTNGLEVLLYLCFQAGGLILRGMETSSGFLKKLVWA